MAINEALRDLIEASAPLWAGEAEIVRTYFDSPSRTAESDRQWLARQCFKEFFGSGYDDLNRGIMCVWGEQMIEKRAELDKGLDRHELLELVESIYAEYHHYCLFADIYDSLADSRQPKLIPAMLRNWPEGERLDKYRYDMHMGHGRLGRAALDFTEGGYCTLYSEGAGLAGRGGVDDRIAAACKRVYDDEVGHMLRGVVALGDLDLNEADWALVKAFVLEQLRLRVEMRNGQFDFPVPAERVRQILAGDIEPIAFDYGLAEEAA